MSESKYEAQILKIIQLQTFWKSTLKSSDIGNKGMEKIIPVKY